MKFSDTPISLHQTGDILLTKSKKMGQIIVKGQEWILKKEGNFSHVAICVCPGVFAESTIGKRLNLFYYKDSSRTISNVTNWRLIRNETVSKNEEIKQQIINSICYQIGKKYDNRIFTSPRKKINSESNIDSEVAICSEFVALVYQQVNHELKCDLFDKPSSQVLPSDIEQLTKKNKKWSEVNHEEEKNHSEDEGIHQAAKIWILSQYIIDTNIIEWTELQNKMDDYLDEIPMIINKANKNDAEEYLRNQGFETGGPDFVYTIFINSLEALVDNQLEICEPQNFRQKIEIDKANNRSALIGRKVFKNFNTFLSLEEDKINTYEQLIENINSSPSGKESTSRFSSHDLLKHLNEQLPIKNIDNQISHLNKKKDLYKDKITDESINSRIENFSNILENIKKLKNKFSET